MRFGLLLFVSGCLFARAPAPPPEDVFYPAPPQEPRIQYLATFESTRDVVGPPSWFRRFVVGDEPASGLGKPYGVAIHGGEIFVCDTRSNVVVIMNLVDRSVELLGARANGRLHKPINVAVDDDGTRYVADTGLRRILVYDSTNAFQRAYGDPERWSPSDLAISGERLYVADVRNGRVAVLDKATGRELGRIGRKGSGRGELVFPTNVAVDRNEHVFVADTGNSRVVEFAPDGEFVRQIGSLGRKLGQFVRPKGIAVDREGRVYVVDSAFENVQIFDSEGRLLLFFGGRGNAPGGLNLPATVAVDYDNVGLFADRVAAGREIEHLILVSSQFGRNKVNVYGFLAPARPGGATQTGRTQDGPRSRAHAGQGARR
ncbi:MAG: 6-bladed beta-propeller [Myxococcota bacterium]